MERLNWATAKILVTGGTGSFGRKFLEIVLREKMPAEVAIFSRDEVKQHDMRQRYPDRDSHVRYFIGDVRDHDRLRRAFRGIDVVIHAAALKQVPVCEYNPFEAVQTNIIGARNVIEAAIDCGVQRVIALSTDKGVNPLNMYGATKLVAEKLFVDGNFYASSASKFSCVRYGNVVGSRGSVVPLFREQRKTGVLTITDPRMTRFGITLEQGVRFVISSVEQMHGGEVFVPKIPSMRILDLAEAVAPGCRTEISGIRPGEKLHEMLISQDETRNTLEFEDMYVITPAFGDCGFQRWSKGKPLPDGFKYSSDTNSSWLSASELSSMIDSDDAVAISESLHQ